MTIDTPFLQHVAVCTVLIIGACFYLGIIKINRKKKIIEPSAQWTASSYFMYLRALIQSSLNLEQLYNCRSLMKGFFEKDFHESLTRKEREKYYSRIHKVFSEKEKQLHAKDLQPLLS